MLREKRKGREDEDIEGDVMLQVRKDLCSGCGLCVQSCPSGAILLFWDKAKIDQRRCNSCRLCEDVCPQGAILEMVPVSKEELMATVSSLRQRTDDLLEKIDKLRR